MTTLSGVESYVVRVAKPVEDPGGSPSGLRGVVHEVSTGHRAVFHDAGELVSLLSGTFPSDSEDDPTAHQTPSTRK